MSALDGLVERAHQPAAGDTARKVVLPGPADDVAATVALAECGLFDDYVSYQGQGVRWFAGNARASVVVDDRLMLRHHPPGRGAARSAEERLLRRLGDAVGRMVGPGERAFGYLAFELARPAEGPVAVGRPLAHFMVPEVEICWSASGVQVTGHDGALIDGVVEILHSVAPLDVPAATPVDLHPPGHRHLYEQRVADAVAAIRRQDLAKAIISRRLEVPFPVALPRSYALGLRQNTPARSYLLRLGDRRCAGFSPEILAAVTAAGEVVTEPLAGTRPLRGDAAKDLRLRQELEWDVKECYEHVISVRQSAAELRRVCDPAGVTVRDLLTVKQRGTVQHLGSSVTGRLAPGHDAWDALEALFPAVTASGISKEQALPVIAASETDPRELYAGAVCMVDALGALDSAVVLRSVFQHRDGPTWLRAGAGIVTDSDPGREYDETTDKLRSVAHCLVRATTKEEGIR
ncbi:salicylate synthase [Streptomyces sp. DSM 118878]